MATLWHHFVRMALGASVMISSSLALAYTEVQADAGRKLFEGPLACQKCHSLVGEGSGRIVAGRPLAGADDALPQTVTTSNGEKVKLVTLADVVDYIFYRMPKENPGSMTEVEAIQLTTYVLQRNGIEADGQPLDHDIARRTRLDVIIPHRRSLRAEFLIGGSGLAVLAIVLFTLLRRFARTRSS